ncbi:GNAT family N-acetyltransferase [Priestia koreensis]|uniref:GNAT family N-acetyltransferase n=1 Tax=Priestia koreensis TaxID=284581 RepID=UPI001F57B8C6|nr:GNAT family protein [Priestia koreensis]MCM3005169.1 GNAT family N-acetyltransferase [Priestia koreensis]UNL83155.1 GNAT family N-acetyltransferase [Priestia koreensis]
MHSKSLFNGQSIKLAAPRVEDVDTMLTWGQDSDYLRNLDTDIAFPYSQEQLELEGEPRSNEAYFRIRTIEDDELIGFVVIHKIEWNNRCGLLAIGIGDPNNRNKGYGKEALQLILRFAFHELNLHRVGLDYISYNPRAAHAYEAVGFKQEGVIRDAVYRDGVHSDRIMMGILRSEWEASQA